VGTWRARASAASITGACVFAVATGAGAVFVGDWWGQHHGPVVTVYVTQSATAAQTSQTTVARADHPRGHRHSRASEVAHEANAQVGAQADAGSAQVAQVTAAPTRRRHPLAPSAPPLVSPDPTVASSGPLPTPSGVNGEPAPGGAITHSPGHPVR
jgi:hypothetical protein